MAQVWAMKCLHYLLSISTTSDSTTSTSSTSSSTKNASRSCRGVRKGILQTMVVNNTGSTLVLRNKYKDVWEDVRFTLAPGQSQLVSWAPHQPYQRLGVLVEQCHPPLLLIGSSTIAQFHQILFSSHSFLKHTFLTVMLPRPPCSHGF